MTRKFLVADLLCGAGGTSTGCERALAAIGRRMELVCINHWPTAIETHKLNHPRARHYVQDIAAVRPHLIVPEGRLDLLMASPTCTHHSVARGGKPTSDQQRSDPWHIVTWLTELRVARLLIENVWEFTQWGPVDPKTMRPIAARKGEYFCTWIDTLKRLGFEPEWYKQNAADFGVAQTRQRFILMARSDGRRLVWPGKTHHKAVDGTLELFPTLKPWKPAREIIDWSIKGKSIFGRKKPLAPKTLARIYAGAVKFAWPEPFLVVLRNHMAAQGIDKPLPTLAANGNHVGLAQPVIVNMKGRSTYSDIDAPLPTQTSHARHLSAVEPVVVRTAMHGRKSPGARGGQDPLMTITTDGGIGFAEPIVLSPQSSGRPRSVDEPLPTLTTGGAGTEDHPGCARPMLAEPFILSRHAEGAPRSTDEPTPTQVAKQSHILIAPYYGSGSGETCSNAEAPVPTLTTKARLGMVVPITHADGANRARDVDREPVPTLTTANRGELAFVTAQFGEREGQAPRVHGIDSPAPSVTASGHINLVEGAMAVESDGVVYDILFRMLEPHELAAASSFPRDYKFAGTKTDQVKQIGNAVPPEMAEAHIRALCADAAPKRERRAA